MSEKRRPWIWELLRGKKRPELDKLEAQLMLGRYEKRKNAGDPAQAPHMKIPLRHK